MTSDISNEERKCCRIVYQRRCASNTKAVIVLLMNAGRLAATASRGTATGSQIQMASLLSGGVYSAKETVSPSMESPVSEANGRAEGYHRAPMGLAG